MPWACSPKPTFATILPKHCSGACGAWSDDQIVPLEISAQLTAKLIPQSKLLVYEDASQGLLHVNKDKLNIDLLAFLRA